jgi:hypothetical protein
MAVAAEDVCGVSALNKETPTPSLSASGLVTNG